MNRLLEEVFEKQRLGADSLSEDALHPEKEEVLVLLFWLGTTRYATTIETVREVVEGAPTTALPLPDAVYSGVLNLRGNLIPVLSPHVISKSHGDSAIATNGARRHVILEIQGGDLFSIEVSKVTKTMLAKEIAKGHPDRLQEIVNVGGEPAYLLNFESQEAKKLFQMRPPEI